MNRNCKDPSLPSYDNIMIDDRSYPLVNLDESYVKKLIKENYTKDYKEEYFIFTIRITGEIVNGKGVMPNPMVDINHIVVENIYYIP